jgi:hypothetical protein
MMYAPQNLNLRAVYKRPRQNGRSVGPEIHFTLVVHAAQQQGDKSNHLTANPIIKVIVSNVGMLWTPMNTIKAAAKNGHTTWLI